MVEVPAQIELVKVFEGIVEDILADLACKRQNACWCLDLISIGGIVGIVTASGDEGLFVCGHGPLHCDGCLALGGASLLQYLSGLVDRLLIVNRHR